MLLIQMIIVTSIYLVAVVAIMIFIQGFVYQASGKRVSIWNYLVSLFHELLYETVESTNNKRKLRYTKCEIYRKVG
ncbi:MAG: hypothetical protein HFJ43_04345 [Clostridia bacterium]|nr:hypothetical protein [Clostridia bacterium]